MNMNQIQLNGITLYSKEICGIKRLTTNYKNEKLLLMLRVYEHCIQKCNLIPIYKLNYVYVIGYADIDS